MNTTQIIRKKISHIEDAIEGLEKERSELKKALKKAMQEEKRDANYIKSTAKIPSKELLAMCAEEYTRTGSLWEARKLHAKHRLTVVSLRRLAFYIAPLVKENGYDILRKAHR